MNKIAQKKGKSNRLDKENLSRTLILSGEVDETTVTEIMQDICDINEIPKIVTTLLFNSIAIIIESKRYGMIRSLLGTKNKVVRSAVLGEIHRYPIAKNPTTCDWTRIGKTSDRRILEDTAGTARK